MVVFILPPFSGEQTSWVHISEDTGYIKVIDVV